MTDFHVSQAGRAYIIGKEGKRNHAYQDVGGVWTCGIGETGEGIGPDTYWTDAEVDEHFASRLASEFEPAVNDALGDAPTTQGQFDAMVSLAYNIGVEGFETSQVLELHKDSDYDKAADAFEHWDHVNGQVNEALHQRRVEEGQMYLDASHTAAAVSGVARQVASPAPAAGVETSLLDKFKAWL